MHSPQGKADPLTIKFIQGKFLVCMINREYTGFPFTTEDNMRELWPTDIQVTPHFLKHPDIVANNSKENSYGIKRWIMRAIFKIKAFYCMFCYAVSQLWACTAEKSKTGIKSQKGTLLDSCTPTATENPTSTNVIPSQKRLPARCGRGKKKRKIFFVKM